MKHIDVALWLLTGINILTNKRERISMIGDKGTIVRIADLIGKKRKLPYRNIKVEVFEQDLFEHYKPFKTK